MEQRDLTLDENQLNELGSPVDTEPPILNSPTQTLVPITNCGDHFSLELSSGVKIVLGSTVLDAGQLCYCAHKLLKDIGVISNGQKKAKNGYMG